MCRLVKRKRKRENTKIQNLPWWFSEKPSKWNDWLFRNANQGISSVFPNGRERKAPFQSVLKAYHWITEQDMPAFGIDHLFGEIRKGYLNVFVISIIADRCATHGLYHADLGFISSPLSCIPYRQARSWCNVMSSYNLLNCTRPSL